MSERDIAAALRELSNLARQIVPTAAKLDRLLDRRLELFRKLREAGVMHKTIAEAAGTEAGAVIQAIKRGRKGV